MPNFIEIGQTSLEKSVKKRYLFGPSGHFFKKWNILQMSYPYTKLSSIQSPSRSITLAPRRRYRSRLPCRLSDEADSEVECVGVHGGGGAVDGEWGDWTLWSSCNATCGTGVRIRTRECTGPYHNGQPCHGESQQMEYCNDNPCRGQYIAYLCASTVAQ